VGRARWAFGVLGLTDVITPDMPRLQGKVGGRVRGPWGPHPAALNSNAEGLGHWFPEHQGKAKTPADRGRFPRSAYCGMIPSCCGSPTATPRRLAWSLRSRRRKHEGEPSYNGSAIQGRVKGGRQVEGGEDRQASRRASPRATSTGSKARGQKDRKDLVPPRPPAGITQAIRCRRARSASPARNQRSRRPRHFLRPTTKAAANSQARSPL
jgi:hypothetical protein